MRRRTSLVLTALLAAVSLRAQDAIERREPQRTLYLPSSHLFACEIPSGWQAFEEEDALGPVVHILGPENPAGTYRAGLSVRWEEKGQAGYVEAQKAVNAMRRSDKETKRDSTAVMHVRVGGALARVFEVVETRTLPSDRLPAREELIHHYLAVIPSGLNYYLLRLSSSRDVYLDFREDFFQCLRTFKPLGH